MGKKDTMPRPHPAAPTSAVAAQLIAKGLAEPAPPSVPTPVEGGEVFDLSRAGKLVVRREKKGRGGKTVTVISGLTLSAAALDALARALRKGLGCGSTLENGAIVLQGEITGRTRDWLVTHGAKQVVIGN